MLLVILKRKLTVKLFCVLLMPQVFNCKGQEYKTEATSFNENLQQNNGLVIVNPNTVFKQIHSNLNGLVTEFVRKIYQDRNGNFWFGTNANGIIRYNNSVLETFYINDNFNSHSGAVRGIVEDNSGNIWFATSSGLIKYNGETFKVFSEADGLASNEIWGLLIDKSGLIWLGTDHGVCQFDGKTFSKFSLPVSVIKNPESMLSNQLVFKFLEDQNGTMWFVVDGNGIYKYKNNNFSQLTKSDGLTDNNVFDLFEDSKGNIWIGTFNGGISKYNGNAFVNFTKDGLVEGLEVYNFCEDKKGNIWFSAENHGVYKFNGEGFKQFTTKDGLATNTIQSIYEDNKGQIWFGTWQGISLYDGSEITNAAQKEPWVK